MEVLVVPYPVFMTPQNGLPFTPWRTCLIEHLLNLHEKIQPRFNYYAKTIRTQCTTDYNHVLIQLIEVEQRRVRDFAQGPTLQYRIRT